MITEIKIPEIGYSMNEATIVEWLAVEGSQISEGDSLCEIETEKTTSEIISSVSGILSKILVAEGTVVKVGEVVCLISDSTEEIKNFPETNKKTDRGEVELDSTLKIGEEEIPARPERIIASPAARALAKDLGIDLSGVTGSGPRGRITLKDIEILRSSETLTRDTDPNLEEEYEILTLTPTRQTISNRLTQSRRDIPDVTTFIQVDITDLVNKRKLLSERPSFTAIIAFAAVKAIAAFPLINSQFVDGQIRRFFNVDLGIAVEAERGLSVPIVRKANLLDLGKLSLEIDTLNKKALSNKLSIGDMVGGSFTITNSGVFGSSFFTPIINAPQVAILGIGKAQKMPMFRGPSLIEGSIITICLSYDHRVIDGGYAVRFLAETQNILKDLL